MNSTQRKVKISSGSESIGRDGTYWVTVQWNGKNTDPGYNEYASFIFELQEAAGSKNLSCRSLPNTDRYCGKIKIGNILNPNLPTMLDTRTRFWARVTMGEAEQGSVEQAREALRDILTPQQSNCCTM